MRYYYMVLKHYEATENNTHFKGEKEDWIHGKAGFLWNKSQSGIPARWWWEHNGYQRRCDARRMLNKEAALAESESARGMWKVSVRLVMFPFAEKEGKTLVTGV